MSSRTEQGQLRVLRKGLEVLQPGLLAVSGGVDSRFLGLLVARWGLDFRPVFFQGPQMSPGEIEQAQAFLKDLGLEFDRLPLDPLDVFEVRSNSRQRCYYCKKHLFARALEHGRAMGRAHVLEGSHLSDQHSFRPGLRALRELGIHSPLATAGLSKSDIRKHARDLSLERPEQPSKPCLLTRFAYGLSPTRSELQRVGQAEDALEALGLRDFRIRMLDRARVLLQITEPAVSRYEALQSHVFEIMNTNGLPFTLMQTDVLTGFFDEAVKPWT